MHSQYSSTLLYPGAAKATVLTARAEDAPHAVLPDTVLFCEAEPQQTQSQDTLIFLVVLFYFIFGWFLFIVLFCKISSFSIWGSSFLLESQGMLPNLVYFPLLEKKQSLCSLELTAVVTRFVTLALSLGISATAVQDPAQPHLLFQEHA